MDVLKPLLLEAVVVLALLAGGFLAVLLAFLPFNLYFHHRMNKIVAARERDEKDRLAQANAVLAKLVPRANAAGLSYSAHRFYRAFDVEGMSLAVAGESLQVQLSYNVRHDGTLEYSELELRTPCCGAAFVYAYAASDEAGKDTCSCDKCGRYFDELDCTMVLYEDEVEGEPSTDWRAFVHNEEDFCSWIQACRPVPLEPLELFVTADALYDDLISTLNIAAEASKPGGDLYPLLHSW